MAELAQTDRADTTTEEKPRNLVSFMAQARKRFARASSSESINRKLAVEDLKFKQGDQWPESIRSERTLSKRPCLTINKMKTFVHQITNDQRQNRPSINVSPIGDKADLKAAKMMKGLIRQIERVSDADFAYDMGFDSAVSNGWGYWRILTDYESEDSFDQVILIEAITNPLRVYLDPDHKKPTGADSNWGFISDLIPRAEFQAEWPNKDALEWGEGGIGDEYRDWSTQTHIRIAEYFYYDTKKRRLLALASGHIGYYDELAPDIKAQVDADPTQIVKERDVDCKYLKWCKLTAKEILEENEWPGKYIPIVKVIGDMVDVEGKISLAGLIRDAKDPQRMYNFWCTAETELIALAPKSPWVIEEGQLEGYEKMWQQANTKTFAYLPYKGTTLGGKPSPPPQRQGFAGVPVGVVEAKQGAAQDMQAVTGIRFDATMHERLADESGKAMRELKKVGDIGSFHYVDNLSRSLKHTGRILIDLIPKVYDTPRILTILREDDTEDQIKVDPTMQKPVGEEETDGRKTNLFNPKIGEYEIAVTVGPSFATKRAEASDSMLGFLKVVPQSGPLIGDLIAKNMDWPGAEEIASRLAAMLPPGILDKEMKDLPPEVKGLVMSLQQQIQKAKQERDHAVQLLGDKEPDRQIKRDQIEAAEKKADQDFEAKLTKIAADMQVALLGSIQGPMASIQKMVQDMEHKFEIGSLQQDHALEMGNQQQDHSIELAQQDMTHQLDSANQDLGHQVQMAGAQQKLAQAKQTKAKNGSR